MAWRIDQAVSPEEKESMTPSANQSRGKQIEFAASCVAVGLSIFTVYTAFFGVFTAMIQRPIHMMLIYIIILLTRPSKIFRKGSWPEHALNLILILFSILSMLWLMKSWERLYVTPYPNSIDMIMGTIGIIITLEATRRTLGSPLMILGIIFLTFAFLGPYFPGMFSHRGYGLGRVVVHAFFGTEGIFGIPAGVAATFVLMFIIFGAFLIVSGGGKAFLDFAMSFTGHYTGGPAKVAVLASGFMGMMSASAVANVATTGSITIPMMKRMGYKPHVAAGIESAASCGGMFMPPIMGATAFVIAEFTGISYIEIALAAAIPAVLYYIALFIMVHFSSAKAGFRGVPKQDLPSFRTTLANSVHLFFPVFVLLALLVLRFTPMYACAYSLGSFVIFSFIRKATRLDFRKIMRALDLGARNAATISAACATAGLIIGIITMTGFAMKLSDLVTDMAGTSLFLGLFFMMVASLILGMGLPPVASYIILAALGAPILSQLGAPLLSTHMFIFYFGTLSTITPPVCVAAYAGAGIAHSDPMKTGFMATRLAFVAFVVPYYMVYYPSLILRGSVIEIVSITLTLLLGIFSFAVFLEGFLSTRITPVERVLILLASVFFFWPSLWHFMVGIALLGSVTYYNRTRASKLISQSNIECPAVSSSRNT